MAFRSAPQEPQPLTNPPPPAKNPPKAPTTSKKPSKLAWALARQPGPSTGRSVSECIICLKLYTSWPSTAEVVDSESMTDPAPPRQRQAPPPPPPPAAAVPPPNPATIFQLGHLHTNKTDSRPREYLFWATDLLQTYPTILTEVKRIVDSAVAATPYRDPRKNEPLTNLQFFLVGTSFATARPTIFLDNPDHRHAQAIIRTLELSGIVGADGLLSNGFVLRAGREHDFWELDEKESNGPQSNGPQSNGLQSNGPREYF